MIKLTDLIFAGRLNGQGDVRLIQFAQPPIELPNVSTIYHPLDLVFDVVIPASSWVSAVANVSRLGDSGARFYIAKAFHQDQAPTNGVAAPSSPSQAWYDGHQG